MNIHYLTIAFGLLLAAPGLAQRNQLQLIRISDDNDGLNMRRQISDAEYTNGTQIDVFYTKSARPRFLSALLISLKPQSNEPATNAPEAPGRAGASGADNLYSVGLTQLMYTPADINKKDILRGDRPYTAVLYGTHSLVSADPVGQQRLTTEISLGVLGKAALGQQAQTWVHEQLGFNTPKGWAHQLPTDVVINYLVQYEKRLIRFSPSVEVLGLASTNLGTLTNAFHAGFTVRAGIYSDYFSNYERPGIRKGASPGARYHKVQAFFFVRPVAHLILTDSALQGGVFTRNEADYVLAPSLFTHEYVQFEYGFVLARNRLGISFSERDLTPQFKNAPSQQIGNLSLFIGL